MTMVMINMRKAEPYVEIMVEFKTVTKAAVLVAKYGEEHWLPRTLLAWTCDKILDDLERGEEFPLKLFEWKAQKLDWI